MKNPIISCILPVYNGEKYLQESIDSVIAQIFTDWELIIINDGSTDGTEGIVDAQEDPRIRVYHNEKNRKLPATLNRGFLMARGQYYTWTSHDNRYLPNAFETYYNKIFMTTADVVYSDCHLINGNGERFAHKPAAPISQLPYSNVVHASFLFRPWIWSILGGYDESLFRAEDWDFWIRAYRAGMKFKEIPVALYEYRVHDGMLCHDWWGCQIAYARTAARHFGMGRAVKQFGYAALQEVK